MSCVVPPRRLAQRPASLATTGAPGQLYGDVDGYLEAFSAALDETIDAGFLLELDREEILATQTEWANEVFAGA